MHIQERKLKSGSKFYLRYWKDGKNCCVLKDVVEKDPSFMGRYPFETRQEAEEFLRRSKSLSDYKNHSGGLAYLRGKDKFIDLDKMVALYFEDIKRWAPESHQSVIVFFAKYTLPYFIFIKKELNFMKWHLHFVPFKNWLEDEVRKGNDYSNLANIDEDNLKLSYSSKNHCIRALNGFYRSMRERGVLPPTFHAKCSFFPKHLVNRNCRTYKDLFLKEKTNEIKASLVEHKFQAAHDFFTVLLNTGMRFNELYSLSVEDIYFQLDVVEGGVQQWVIDELRKVDEFVYGYIVLTSQVKNKARPTNSDGDVERKPLKGRKTMSLKDGRVIPITCRDAVRILQTRYNLRIKEFNKDKLYGHNLKNYFLFDEEHGDIYGQFRTVSDQSFHTCRHTFTTMLVGKTRNKELTRAITGHNSECSFERYLHTHEEMVMNAKKENRKHKLVAVLPTSPLDKKAS